MRKNRSREVIFLRKKGGIHGTMVWTLIFLKLSIGAGVVYYILNFLSPFWWVWHVIISYVIVIFIIMNKRVKLQSIRMERTFRQNLNSREQQHSLSYGRKLKGSDLQIATVELPQQTKWGGRSLSQLHFGRTEHIHIAAIIRGNQRINIPGGNSRIYPGDRLEIVSDKEGINTFKQRLQSDVWTVGEHKPLHDRLYLISLSISSTSPLCGKTLQEIDFRTKYHCMVVGTEDMNGNLQMTQAQRRFEANDTIWVVGEDADLSLLKMGI